MIIHGKVATDLDAKAYHEYKPRAMGAVLESWGRLTAQYDCVLVEGAGSPAEINLRDRDIANMGFAEAVDCPVIIVADIDRGGVFRPLGRYAGTAFGVRAGARRWFRHQPFSRRHRAARTPASTGSNNVLASRCSGVLPYLHGLMLDAEDAIATSTVDGKKTARIRAVAPAYPAHFQPQRPRSAAPAPAGRFSLDWAGRGAAGRPT